MRTLTAALAAAAVVMAGCSGDPGQQAEPSPTPTVIGFTPVDASTGVEPDSTVTVTVDDGRLTSVAVTDEEGTAVPGGYGQSQQSWSSAGRLALGTTYKVSATADDDGELTTRTASFTTLDPPKAKRLKASTISPLDGMTVGVAQPLAVGFNRSVPDRTAIQKALRVETQPKVEGAWYWIDDEYVHFRPREFWPAGTKVTLHAEIAGLDAGDGVWGAADRTISFTIGRQQIIRVNVKTKRMVVERDGRAIRTFPVSTGKKGWETRNGIKVVQDKIRNKRWTDEAIDAPEDYELKSSYAMRMTNSGEFIHDAPWNPNIGASNASHGCVGLRVRDMKWLFANTIRGDAIVVTGSPKPYTQIWNRYQDWNVPWATWSAGNSSA